MKPDRIFLTLFALLFTIPLAACSGTPTPGKTPMMNSVATSAAATITAISPPSGMPTNTPAAPATPAPSALPSSSFAVVFVDVAHNLLAWNPSSMTYIPIATTGDVQEAWISPDGALVVFSRSTDYQSYDLDVIRSDGSNHHTLFSHDQFLALPHPVGTLGTTPEQLAWIPNSHRIAMTVSIVLNGPGSVIGNDLMVIDAEDGTVSRLLIEKESWQFAFSSDGSKIAVSLPDGMDLFDANGKTLAPSKFFEFPLVNTASEYEYTPRVTWKDDSTAFAFTIPPIAPFSDDPNSKTRVIVVDAVNATFTTPLTVPMMYQFPQEISPNLSHIAYTQSTDGATNVVDLHIAALDGSMDEVYLANHKVNQFIWSPDSRHFLFAYNDGTNRVANLGSIGSMGTTIPQITSMRHAEWLDALHYLIVDKSATGWKIWHGTVGSDPQLVYSDSNAEDGQIFIHTSVKD